MQLTPTLDDTIVACATAAGEAALAIVRLSGPGARTISMKLAPRPAMRQSHKLYRAEIFDAEKHLLDDAMFVEMWGPHSFTGEDVVEFHLHGSRQIVQSVLDTCQKFGARLALPGEFSQRAFIRGKIDLAQAEAVSDLIASYNEKQKAVALAQLKGHFSERISGLISQLEVVLTAWKAALDFPEYPTGDGFGATHEAILKDVSCNIQQIIENAQVNRRSGYRVVLCGAPNVGKSSLINRWLGQERVLVDDLPGTTRDPIEVDMTQGLRKWSLVDTAGIREAKDALESRGIGMAIERIEKADLALWLINPDTPSWPDEMWHCQIVGSKADLASPNRRSELEAEAARRGLVFWGWVSTRTGEGVDALMKFLAEPANVSAAHDDIVVTRERHLEALRRAQNALSGALNTYQAGQTLDVLCMDLEMAAKYLGEILGRTIDDEVFERIFRDFCIGK